MSICQNVNDKNLWIITRDHIEDGAAVGTGSPEWSFQPILRRSQKHLAELIKKYELSVRFKMYDDDGELYYEGSMQIEDFHPLDDYGMPNAGCTYLEYSRNNEAFEML